MREQLLQESGGGVCLQPGGEEGRGTPPGASELERSSTELVEATLKVGRHMLAACWVLS